MATPLLYKALDKYAELFQKREKYPIEWDSKIGQFIYISDKKSLRIWYLGQTVLFFGVFCCIVAALVQLFSKQQIFPLWIVAAVVTVGFIFGTVALFFGIAMIMHGRDAIACWNNLMSLKRPNQNVKLLQKSKRNEKIIAVFLSGFIYVTKYLGLLCPVVFVIAKTDVFYLLFRDVLDMNHPIAAAVRFSLLLICCIEATRTLALAISLSITSVHVLNYLIVSCNSVRQTQPILNIRVQLTKEIFGNLQILLTLSSSCMESPIFIGLAGGLFLAIASCYSTVKLIGILPLFFYIYGAVFSVLTPPVMMFFISQTIETYEMSRNIIQKLNRGVQNKSNRAQKYNIRLLKSMQPLTFFSGLNGFRFFKLKQSTKSTYYSVTVNHTITALLSIPANKFM